LRVGIGRGFECVGISIFLRGYNAMIKLLWHCVDMGLNNNLYGHSDNHPDKYMGVIIGYGQTLLDISTVKYV
jgi:hypothetical protein